MAILRIAKFLLISCVLISNTVFANAFFAPTSSKYEYRFATLSSNPAQLTEDEKALIAEIKAQLQPIFVDSIKSFGINFLMSVKKTEFFKTLGKNLDTKINPILEKYNDLLPANQPTFLNAYIMPWDASAPNKELKELPEDLQMLNQYFKVVEHTAEEADSSYLPNFANGILDQDRVNYSTSEYAYFNGISMQFKLQKDNSAFQLQFLGTLNPKSGDFTEANDQVEFHSYVIPRGKILDIYGKARMLATFSKKFGKDASPFAAKINFGKLSKDLIQSNNFQFAWQLEQYDGQKAKKACKDRKMYAPQLHGWAKIAFDGFLYENAHFYIFEIDINPNVIKVDQMDVRIGLPLRLDAPWNRKKGLDFGFYYLDCMQFESVGKQFAETVDEQVQDMIKKVTAPDDMTDMLLEELLGGDQAQFNDLF